MSNKLEKKIEKILQLLEKLGKESKRGVPIIVEGRKDVSALQRLGVKGEIILTKTSGKSFLDVVGEVDERGKREVILLMDFDRRGREWTKRLTQHLETMRVKPNSLFWKEFQNLAGREVKDIEGLATYISTLRKKCGVQNSKV